MCIRLSECLVGRMKDSSLQGSFQGRMNQPPINSQHPMFATITWGKVVSSPSLRYFILHTYRLFNWSRMISPFISEIWYFCLSRPLLSHSIFFSPLVNFICMYHPIVFHVASQIHLTCPFRVLGDPTLIHFPTPRLRP